MHIKTSLSLVAGAIAEWVFPALARRVAHGDQRAVSTRCGGLIRRAQLRRAAAGGNWDTLRQGLKTYWVSRQSDQFYSTFAGRFEKYFLQAHYPVVDALCAAVESGSFHQLVEVGCGDGRVLQHLASRLPTLDALTGLDLNAGIISRNQRVYAGEPRLRFSTADALDWIPAHAGPGTAVMTYGGVLEYFSQENLEKLFALLARSAAPSLVALVEPIAEDWDTARETESRPHGVEFSFSHPYRRLLESAGFSILFSADVQLEARWIMIVART